MTDRQLLNSLIKGMEGSKNPVIYGSGLYLQLVDSFSNPNNDLSDYERDIKNIDSIQVDWKSWDNPEYCLHINLKRKNGSGCNIETCVELNPLQTYFNMGKESRSF